MLVARLQGASLGYKRFAFGTVACRLFVKRFSVWHFKSTNPASSGFHFALGSSEKSNGSSGCIEWLIESGSYEKKRWLQKETNAFSCSLALGCKHPSAQLELSREHSL
ncbi:MAG: hypothetical protein ACI87E_000087 [Mariniblastus sp.]|jgi:hypothetical protein